MHVMAARVRPGSRVRAALLWALIVAVPSAPHAQPPLNVLFLVIDDLRPELPYYGRPDGIPMPAMIDGCDPALADGAAAIARIRTDEPAPVDHR